MTLDELLPGKMGRVVLTRAALRLRMPALLKIPEDQELDEELLVKLQAAIAEVQKG